MAIVFGLENLTFWPKVTFGLGNIPKKYQFFYAFPYFVFVFFFLSIFPQLDVPEYRAWMSEWVHTALMMFQDLLGFGRSKWVRDPHKDNPAWSTVSR